MGPTLQDMYMVQIFTMLCQYAILGLLVLWFIVDKFTVHKPKEEELEQPPVALPVYRQQERHKSL